MSHAEKPLPVAIHTHRFGSHAGIAICYPPNVSGTVYLTSDECRDLASNLADIAASLEGFKVGNGLSLRRIVRTAGVPR